MALQHLHAEHLTCQGADDPIKSTIGRRLICDSSDRWRGSPKPRDQRPRNSPKLEVTSFNDGGRAQRRA